MTSPESNTGETPDAGHPPSFEDSLAELQQIAHELEEGTLGLEESLRRFERGVALLRQCYRTLEQAEQRIEVLTGFDAAGNAVTAPFDASATVDEKSSPAAGKRKRRREKPSPEPAQPDDSTKPEQSDPHTRLF